MAVLLVGAGLVAVGASPAQAAVGDLTYAACIANAGAVAGCTDATNATFGGLSRPAAFPDGKNVSMWLPPLV